jgi:D-alanine-D-alanine ligase
MKVLVLTHTTTIPPEKTSAKARRWADWNTEYTVIQSLKNSGHTVEVVGLDHDLSVLDKAVDTFVPDIVFNLIQEFQDQVIFEQHLVSYLELKNIPYTGCSPRGLTLTRDKALAKTLLERQGILTPKFFSVARGQSVPAQLPLTFPMIVKSQTEEASLGIAQSSVVTNAKKLQERVTFIHEQIGTDALVEEYIEGRELYVSILGNKRMQTLPPWELFMDSLNKESYPIATRNLKFSEKYCKKHNIRRGSAKDLSPLLEKQISNACKAAARALELNGYMRADLRLTADGRIYILEVNPNPELAEGEDLADAAQLMGLSYKQLIERILNLGLSWAQSAA